VVLPEPFAMTLDTDASEGISRATPVNVSWDASPAANDSILWSVEGRCIWTESGVTPDDGSFELDAENLRVRGTRLGDECEVALTLDRSSEGQVDSVLVPGSSFKAVQRRAVRFVSTPAPGELISAPSAADAGG
jgi:hypothetical protein